MGSIKYALPLALMGSSMFVLQATASPANTCPAAESVVSPDVSRQATTATVGMIADRVAAVASGIGVSGVGSNGGLGFAVRCGQVALTEDDSPSSATPIARLGQVDTTSENAGKAVPAQGGAPSPDNGVWVSTTATWLKKTDPSGEFSGDVVTVVTGYDRKVTSEMIAGLALGAESGYIDTRYNNGTIRAKSVSVAPYVGYALTDWLTIDATIGHAWVYYNYTDGSAAAEVYSGGHASRWFGATDLTAKEHLDDWVLTQSVGYMRVSETEESYMAGTTAIPTTAVNVGQIRGTVGVGYNLMTSWAKLTPSAFIRGQYDVPHQGATTLATGFVSTTDTTSAVFGVSMDAVIDKVWTFNVVGYTEQFRQNSSASPLGLSGRYSF
jgi:hypothetical protein